MTVTDWLERLNTEIAENDEWRLANRDMPTIKTLVEIGRLPAEALNWRGRRAA